MSLHDYQESQRISAQDPPFYALIMACFREADTDNLWKLQRAFPAKWREFQERYNAPGGLLEEESGPFCMPVKDTEARSRPLGALVLGSFNDYDHSKEDSDGT